MFFSTNLSLLGLGFFCWMLFSLVNALPAFVAVTVGHYAITSELLALRHSY